ncbi:unnamed protein product [Ectocarpus sp. 12 AP-2014]
MGGPSATHGGTVEAATDGNGAVTAASNPSRSLCAATGVERRAATGVERAGVGDVRGGGLGISGGSSNSIGSGGAGVGATAVGGPPTWSRAEEYGATGAGAVPDRPPPQRADVSLASPSRFEARPPAPAVSGVTVPGFGTIAVGAILQRPPTSES